MSRKPGQPACSAICLKRSIGKALISGLHVLVGFSCCGFPFLSSDVLAVAFPFFVFLASSGSLSSCSLPAFDLSFMAQTVVHGENPVCPSLVLLIFFVAFLRSKHMYNSYWCSGLRFECLIVPYILRPTRFARVTKKSVPYAIHNQPLPLLPCSCAWLC